jgi:hypothetical protein
MRLESGFIKDPKYNTIAKLSDYFKVNMETFKRGTLL